MTCVHEALVATRFNELHHRFRDTAAPDDFRFHAIIAALKPVAGLRILDLGCGKGRFARLLMNAGACVVGADISTAMLGAARGVSRVAASALRLPFRDSVFDAVIAIEMLEHVPSRALGTVLGEMRRVLRAEGRAVILDKNRYALDPNRPWLPRALVKWIDERRGLWMYAPHEAAREQWFGPWSLSRQLTRHIGPSQVSFLLDSNEQRHWVFRKLDSTRSMVCWSALKCGGPA